jgi:hypothetical protein
LVAASCSSTPSTTTPSPKSKKTSVPATALEVTLLDKIASPEFGVLRKVTDKVTDKGISHSSSLLTTRNFSQYQAISLPTAPNRPTTRLVALSASFPTTENGWVVASTRDESAGYLLHTVDGGAQWSTPEPVWVGSGGTGQVDFLNTQDGWLLAGNPAAQGVSFQATTDGGSTWSVLPVPAFSSFFNGALVFTTPTDGFAVAPNTGTILSRPVMEKTENGGRSWTAATVPGLPSSTATMEQPQFFGAVGVLPIVIVSKGSHTVKVLFDISQDKGATWKTGVTRVIGAQPIQSTSGTGAYEAPVSVSVANGSSWWIAGASASGTWLVYRTSDAGRNWNVVDSGSGLPNVRQRLATGIEGLGNLQAVNGSQALFTVQVAPTENVTYVTADGGREWSVGTFG